MNKLPELSVFFPCYNEERNIGLLLEQSLKLLPTLAQKYELIVVDDGSTDKTANVVESYMQKSPFIRLVKKPNGGYGSAVKAGFTAANYKWVFYTDSDLQFDLNELSKFIPFVDTNDLIIGYRLRRSEGMFRSLLAKMLKLWNLVFLGFPLYIKDIDCAFKLISQKALNEIGALNTDGAMLTTEYLLKSIKLGLSIKQIGVNHYKRLYGKPTGSNPEVILKAIKETFKLKKEMDTNFNQVRELRLKLA